MLYLTSLPHIVKRVTAAAALVLVASAVHAADAPSTSFGAAIGQTATLRAIPGDAVETPDSMVSLELIHPWDNPQRHDSTLSRGPSAELRPFPEESAGGPSLATPDLSADRVAAAKPRDLGAITNYPNPFNAETRIQYRLAEAGPVSLTIFNLLGQAVRQVDLGHVESGVHDWIWNGMLEGGRPAPSGIYFYRIESREASAINKMVLLK